MLKLEIIAERHDHVTLRRLLRRAGFANRFSFEYRHRSHEEQLLEIWSRARPAIIPWMELNQNVPDKVQDVADGLNLWGRVCDRAIITTVPGQLSIYDELRDRVRDVAIIPGLKTNDDLKRFDDVMGWKRIGEQLADVAERTGSDTVVLENESAIKAYANGKQRISSPRLRRALGQLPSDLTILWYPSITGSSHGQLKRMQHVCDVVAEVHADMVFVDLSRSGPAAVRHLWSKRQREKLDAVVKSAPAARCIDMLYFYGPGSRWWMYEQIDEALAVLGKDADQAIIYPGGERWVPAAEKIGEKLRAGR